MSDYLKGLQTLTIIVCVLLGIGTVIGMVDLLTGDDIVTKILIVEESLPSTLFPPGISPAAPGEIDVNVVAPTVEQRVLYGLTQAPTAILLLVALITLAFVLNRARRDGPFTKRTVRGLRWIGLTLTGGLLAAVVEAWAQVALTSTITPDTWAYSVSLPFGWLFGGFVCFAVAEMVSRGTTLRDELETVI